MWNEARAKFWAVVARPSLRHLFDPHTLFRKSSLRPSSRSSIHDERARVDERPAAATAAAIRNFLTDTCSVHNLDKQTANKVTSTELRKEQNTARIPEQDRNSCSQGFISKRLNAQAKDRLGTEPATKIEQECA